MRLMGKGKRERFLSYLSPTFRSCDVWMWHTNSLSGGIAGIRLANGEKRSKRPGRLLAYAWPTWRCGGMEFDPFLQLSIAWSHFGRQETIVKGRKGWW